MNKVFEIESIKTFSQVIDGILNNLYSSKQSSDIILEPHIIQAAKEDVKKLLSSTNFDMETISNGLQDKGWDKDKVDLFVSLIESRKTELLYATLLNHNSKYGDALVDFDWVLKLVMGTNDLKTLNYPLLQLILNTINSEGVVKNCVYDINKEMLGKLIALLENIDNAE